MELLQITGFTKTEIASKAEAFIQELLENGDAVQAAEFIAVVGEAVKKIKEDNRFTDLVRSAIENNGTPIKTSSGAKIELCETGVTYDYYNDRTWQLLKMSADKANKDLKEREDYLKKIPAGKQLMDEETGELIAVGPVKSSKSTYKVTLAKGDPSVVVAQYDYDLKTTIVESCK